MKKLGKEERMMRLAWIIANTIEIPDHCTLDREDIFQEVCLMYLDKGYTQTPGHLKRDVSTAIRKYVIEYSLLIPCGDLNEAYEYEMEQEAMVSAISAIAETSIKEVLNTLTPREEKSLILYFGIGCDAMNMHEIGKELGVTHTRVAQIINKALRKCRHPSRFKKLHDVQEMMFTDTYYQ